MLRVLVYPALAAFSSASPMLIQLILYVTASIGCSARVCENRDRSDKNGKLLEPVAVQFII